MVFIAGELIRNYKSVEIRKRRFFIKNTGAVFAPAVFPGECAIVIEYADSIDDANKYTLEDGDVFFIEDYQEFSDLYKAIIAEIEEY